VLSCVTRRARHKGKTVGDDDDGVPTLGAETIAAAVHLMSQLYATAMREVPPIVSSSPFAALELPAITPHTIDYFEHDETETLFDAIEQLSGEAARTVVELGMWVGLRPGELFGLHGHRVNWLRGTVEVIDVMTRMPGTEDGPPPAPFAWRDAECCVTAGHHRPSGSGDSRAASAPADAPGADSPVFPTDAIGLVVEPVSVHAFPLGQLAFLCAIAGPRPGAGVLEARAE
jgi:hypothetical protein